jgi:hypothetical protein
MKVFALNHNGVLDNVLDGFEIVENPWDADRIVLWTDLFQFERSIIDLARTRGIPTIVVQHGRRGSSRYFQPFNEPIYADKLLVWGTDDKVALTSAGHPRDKIIVTGSPVLHKIQPREDHEGINVVFCPEHWDKEVPENKATIKELKKLKGVNLITKIIEGHDPKLYPNPVFSHRESPDHLDICIDVLKTADLVVGVSESTFELLAQAMNIPVVIMEEWKPKACSGDKRYRSYRRVISSASKRATIQTLLSVVKQQLNEPNELQKERRDVCISEGGIQLDAKKEIQKRIIGKK